MLPLPDRLEGLIGKDTHGPNCWNATQMYFNDEVYPKFVTREAMNSWLKAHTLEVERLQPGDILVFRDGDELVHTAVALSTRTFFHKKGSGGLYEITSKIDIIREYGAERYIHRWG